MLLKTHNLRFIIAMFKNLLVAAYLAAQEKLQVGNHEGDEGDDAEESAQEPEDELQRGEARCLDYGGTEEEEEWAMVEYEEHLEKEHLEGRVDYNSMTHDDFEYGFLEFCKMLAELRQERVNYDRHTVPDMEMMAIAVCMRGRFV